MAHELERHMEAALIERAQAGNRHALDQLLKEAYPYVLGYLIKMSQDQDLAKELTQETMVKAIVNIRKFRGDAKFSSWLVTIGANLYKDSLRRSRAIIPLSREEEVRDQVLDSGYASGSDSVEEQVIQKAMGEDLQKALKKLPQGQRQAFILKHCLGYSYDQIAKIADCPLGTVRSRIHNAALTLKSVLEKGGWP